MKGATEHVSRIRLSRGLEVIKVGVFNFNYRKGRRRKRKYKKKSYLRVREGGNQEQDLRMIF